MYMKYILSFLVLLFICFTIQAQYSLTVESSPAVHVPGNTVYRFYVNMTDASDKFSAVYGNDQENLVINTPAGIFNSSFNASWSAAGINPAFLAFFPDMVEDSYATIGLEGPAVGSQADPSIVEDVDLSPSVSSYFVNGGTNLNVNTLTGASWYVLNTAANALPDGDLRVLVMQVTTAGSVDGTVNFQVFPLGVGADQVQVSIDFDGTGTFNNTYCSIRESQYKTFLWGFLDLYSNRQRYMISTTGITLQTLRSDMDPNMQERLLRP